MSMILYLCSYAVERERERELPKGAAKTRRWPEEKFRARADVIAFSRRTIDRSIGRDLLHTPLSRARICSRVLCDELAVRSLSVYLVRRDENYGSLDRIDLGELAADFYASRRKFLRRTASFASQGRPETAGVCICLFLLFARHDMRIYFKMTRRIRDSPRIFICTRQQGRF